MEAFEGDGRVRGNVWCLYRFGRRGIIYIRVCARGARRNNEEFIEGKDAGFAAFPAFLSLVEDRRAGMVDALFVVILVRLSAAFVHALLRHGSLLVEMMRR